MDAKRSVARASAKLIKAGQRVGVGAGSTVVCFLQELALRFEKSQEELPDIVCAAFSSELEAKKLGFNVSRVGMASNLDYCFDGADEIDLQLGVLKGGGASLFREKQLFRLAAMHSAPYYYFATEEKLTTQLGTRAPLTLELHIDSLPALEAELQQRSGLKDFNVRIGTGIYGPIFTEQGNILVDVFFRGPDQLREFLCAVPSTVLEHGFFQPSGRVLIGRASGEVDELEFQATEL